MSAPSVGACGRLTARGSYLDQLLADPVTTAEADDELDDELDAVSDPEWARWWTDHDHPGVDPVTDGPADGSGADGPEDPAEEPATAGGHEVAVAQRPARAPVAQRPARAVRPPAPSPLAVGVPGERRHRLGLPRRGPRGRTAERSQLPGTGVRVERRGPAWSDLAPR